LPKGKTGKKRRTAAVKMDRELIPPMKKLIARVKDGFGRQKYASVSEAVTEAVEDFLKKHREGRGTAEW